MASTNKTTNYDLSQFIETDKPGWLTDYNSDMRKLDTALKGVSDVASGASGSITDLANRMTNAEGNIITNANDIDALEARADSLEAQAQSTAGTIVGIQTEQTAQNLGIEAATELGYNLARPYDSASTYAVGAYVLFQNTLYKCITAVSTGEAFDPTKWLAIKATDEIAAGGYTLPIASASQLGGVKVGDGLNIDPLTGALNAGGYTLPIASASELGGVKVGNGLSIDPLTGVLSAGSGGVEIVPLNSTNISFNVSSARYTNYTNYYSGNLGTGTQTPMSGVRIVAQNDSFLIRLGTKSILFLHLAFNDLTVTGIQSKAISLIELFFTVTSDVVTLPTSKVYSQLIDHAPAINNLDGNIQLSDGTCLATFREFIGENTSGGVSNFNGRFVLVF